MKDSSNWTDSEDAKDPKNLYRRIQGLVGEQSFSLILPKQFAINLGIRKGDFVKVRQEQDRIIVEKAEIK